MRITVVGCRPYDFKDDQTGRQVAGLSVYYTAPDAGDSTLHGEIAAKLSVKLGTELYDRMLSADYSEPFLAETVFDMNPGSKKAVLSDIQF